MSIGCSQRGRRYSHPLDISVKTASWQIVVGDHSWGLVQQLLTDAVSAMTGLVHLLGEAPSKGAHALFLIHVHALQQLNYSAWPWC